MKQVHIALLGMGRIGKIHFRNIEQHFPKAKIVAVADPQWMSLFRQQYGKVLFSKNPYDAIQQEGILMQ